MNRRLLLSTIGILVVMIFTVFGCGGGGGSDDDSGESVVGTLIGLGGGIVKPEKGADLSPGTQLVVPPNAASEEVSILLTVSESLAGTLAEEADVPTITAIMAFAMDRSDEDYLHPMFTPAAILAGGTHVGLDFKLSPDGTQFSLPVSLEIPLADISMQSSDLAIVLLKSAGGDMEVVPEAQMTVDTLKVPLYHFSDVSPWKIIGNMAAFAVISATMFPKDEIEHAKQLVDPFVAEVNKDILDAHCSQSGIDPFVNSNMLPTNFQLLSNLAAISDVQIGGDSLGLQNPLKDWILNVRLQGLPSVSIAEIYTKSLELTGGDVFKALVLAHEVLRSDRFPKEFKDLIQDVRGDNSDDEVGARYHLLGTAIYGFWYEHMQNQPDPSKLNIPPDMASFLEEAFVSGHVDIFTDPGEYVVDLAGAELGRNLYKATIAAHEGTEGPCDDSDDNSTGPLTGEEICALTPQVRASLYTIDPSHYLSFFTYRYEDIPGGVTGCRNDSYNLYTGKDVNFDVVLFTSESSANSYYQQVRDKMVAEILSFGESDCSTTVNFGDEGWKGCIDGAEHYAIVRVGRFVLLGHADGLESIDPLITRMESTVNAILVSEN